MKEKNLSKTPVFVDVILPLPLPKPYTYFVPETLQETVFPGSRLLVQFGKKRILTAVAWHIHNTPPEIYSAKAIIDVLDEEPLITEKQIQLYEWISDYYLCSLGEVLNVALPSGLKLTSESRIELNPAFDRKATQEVFSEKELTLLETISRHENIALKEVSKLSDIPNPLPVIKKLLEKETIFLFEEIKEKFRPKKIRKLRLKAEFQSKEKIKFLLDEKLKGKQKQTDILLKYLALAPLHDRELQEKGILKKYLLEMAGGASSLRMMIQHGIFEEFQEIIPRFRDEKESLQKEILLSPAQTLAKEQILNAFFEKEIVLLHGVTGSGKTEVYIELIKNALSGGSQVLYLLPEIALTTQIVERLKKVFGNKLGVYHSKFSDNERVEIYKGLWTGKYQVIVGVRSSVLLPFDNLGLIIVDEEHESSYKQQEPAPRYHARDTAFILARIHHAKTLLGSATPSVETYYHTQTGKWERVELTERYGDAKLPDILLADIRRERKMKTMHNEFSSLLLQEMRNTLEKKEQIILFQNRRGYAPFLSCEDCGFVFSCKHCDVSLTYHLSSGELRCHYCGDSRNIDSSCPACGSTKLKISGFGTEKIEEDLNFLLPQTTVTRMDLDTTRKKNSYTEILAAFQEGKTEILVGTQMVSKGLDFKNVTLVGIFDADRIIHFPDFRAKERAYQMLVQVSGRAGRTEKAGKVIIQTQNPDQDIFRLVRTNDFVKLYEKELPERNRFHYPPFTRLTKLTLKHKDPEKVQKMALKLKSTLESKLGRSRVLGPEVPLVNKIRNQYLLGIYIKFEREKINLTKAKDIILSSIRKTLKTFDAHAEISIDVDPI